MAAGAATALLELELDMLVGLMIFEVDTEPARSEKALEFGVLFKAKAELCLGL